MSVEYKVTCRWCPLQSEGTLSDGRTWYYRSRHGEWHLDVPFGTTIAHGPDGDTIEEMEAILNSVLTTTHQETT